MSQITLSEGAAASTPSSGKVTLYAKSDGLLYSKDDAGSETALGGGGSVATDAIWTAKGQIAAATGSGAASALNVGADGTVLMADSAQATGVKWAAAGGSGTVTSVSVVSANGLAGSVANATTTPAITLSTSISGVLKGNGTAISAASSGTDYVAPGAVTSNGVTMSTARMLGRTTAGTGAIEELTAASATAFLENVVGDSGSGGTKGLVPAPASGDAAAGKFLKADGTWAAPSAGTGDVTGQASSVDSEIALFSGTGGKTIKRATGSGMAKITSGVLGTGTAGTDYAKPDTASDWSAPQKSSPITDNDLSFDLSGAGNNYFCTPTAGGALTFTNIAANAGKSGIVHLVNGSNYAITAHTNTKVTSGLMTTLSATGTYIVGYYCDGTNVHINCAGASA